MRLDRKLLLVVDDDSEIRAALDEALASEGYKVFVAANGRDALDMLRFGLKPSAILLDLMMPILNGFDFIEELKKDPALRRPVIVLSASTSYTAQDLGVEAVLHKPVNLDDITAAIERAAVAD